MEDGNRRQKPLSKQDQAVQYKRPSPLRMAVSVTLGWVLILPLPVAIVAVMAGFMARVSYELFQFGWDLFGFAP